MRGAATETDAATIKARPKRKAPSRDIVRPAPPPAPASGRSHRAVYQIIVAANPGSVSTMGRYATPFAMVSVPNCSGPRRSGNRRFCATGRANAKICAM